MKTKELVEIYKSDYAFLKLSDNTKRSYSYYLKIIVSRYGNSNSLKIAEREIIFDFKKYTSKFFVITPRKAKYLMSVYKILVKWAYRNGFIRHDISQFLKIDYAYSPKIKNVWSENDIIYVTNNASKPIQDFIFLAVETGLRRCDLIRLRFEHIHIINDKKFLIIETQKTKQKVGIPFSIALQEWIERLKYTTGFLLRSTNGKPWHEDKFNHAWQRLKKRLELKNITPHGLRKTAVTRLAKAGCEPLEISAILGWSIRSVHSMLDKHYFQDKLSVASSAISKLDEYRNSS